jgi:hypothetical protein
MVFVHNIFYLYSASAGNLVHDIYGVTYGFPFSGIFSCGRMGHSGIGLVEPCMSSQHFRPMISGNGLLMSSNIALLHRIMLPSTFMILTASLMASKIVRHSPAMELRSSLLIIGVSFFVPLGLSVFCFFFVFVFLTILMLYLRLLRLLAPLTPRTLFLI